MLLSHICGIIGRRSTKSFSAKMMGPLAEVLSSSKVLFKADSERKPPNRDLKFSTVQMMTMLIYIQIKHLGVDDYKEMVKGRDSQVILKNLGMPTDKNGRYIAPSTGWISQFKNHEYPEFEEALEAEFLADVLAMTNGEHRVITIDSTPLEASRYSSWADFNPHYKIHMGKSHLIMINGIVTCMKFTNGNAGDNPSFLEMLSQMPTRRLKDTELLSDGSYDSFETYAQVFMKFGVVMGSNTGAGSVKHDEAAWDNVLRHYNKYSKDKGFIPSGKAAPDQILRFLTSRGKSELVGKALRNMDMSRGIRIQELHALKRHVCETVHHAMKRWVDYTVRGLHEKYVESTVRLRTFTCSLLSVYFKRQKIAGY